MSQKEIVIDIARSTKDLQQIIALQHVNHKLSLSDEERLENGFVTLRHDLEQLQQMMESVPQVVARSTKGIIGFALVLLKEHANMFPILHSMFEIFDETIYKGQILGNTSYYVMGQVCIDKDYRGQGIFQRLYQEQKRLLSSSFDLCLTEASVHNKPSMRAHQKVGFKILKEYSDHTDDWAMLLWDWS